MQETLFVKQEMLLAEPEMLQPDQSLAQACALASYLLRPTFGPASLMAQAYPLSLRASYSLEEWSVR